MKTDHWIEGAIDGSRKEGGMVVVGGGREEVDS
jgi:hypothetical protein